MKIITILLSDGVLIFRYDKTSFIFLSYLFFDFFFFCPFHILDCLLDFFEDMLNQRMLFEALMHNVLITYFLDSLCGSDNQFAVNWAYYDFD